MNAYLWSKKCFQRRFGIREMKYAEPSPLMKGLLPPANEIANNNGQ